MSVENLHTRAFASEVVVGQTENACKMHGGIFCLLIFMKLKGLCDGRVDQG